MDRFIELPYGGQDAGFHISELIAHMQKAGMGYIIQGQQNCALDDHTKPHSLDMWLRRGFSERKDAKQADNKVVDALVDSGHFEIAYLPCPDSGRWCKALMLLED